MTMQSDRHDNSLTQSATGQTILLTAALVAVTAFAFWFYIL
jgi:hypothetical protein